VGGPDDKESAELSSASVAIGGVRRRTWTGVDAESEGSRVVTGRLSAGTDEDHGGST